MDSKIVLLNDYIVLKDGKLMLYQGTGTIPNIYTFGYGDGLCGQWDGSQWSEILPVSGNQNLYYYWNCAAKDSNGDIYVGGYCDEGIVVNGVTFNAIMKYSPATNTWSSLKDGGINTVDGVYSLIVDSQGKLYVGGSFVSVGNNVTVSSIAIYDPSLESGNWSALKEGGVYADSYPGNIDSMVFDSQGKLYVGGSFNTVGSAVSASNIAIYDPSLESGNWSALKEGGPTEYSWEVPGQGVGSYGAYVSVLAFDSTGKLYVGGGFYKVGSELLVSNIAIYDHSLQSGNWSALKEGGTDRFVSALAFDSNGKLYIGGGFNKAAYWLPYFGYSGESIDANAIVIYDHSLQSGNWSALKEGGLPSGYIFGLAFDSQGKLYIVGSFNKSITNATITNIGVYDHSLSANNWSNLSEGFSESICAFVVK